MNPLVKIHIYLKSGGWRETIGYVLKGIIKLAYNHSQTDFFLYERNGQNLDEISVKPTPVSFRRYCQDNSSELFQLQFPRLFCHSVQKWLDNGSRIYVGFFNKKPVSYAVCHEKSYAFKELGLLQLDNAQGWIGPVFVDISARKRGINKKQILHLMLTESECSTFLTSANSFNRASCQTFLGLGFRRLGVMKEKKWLSVFGKTSFQYTDATAKKLSILHPKTK